MGNNTIHYIIVMNFKDEPALSILETRQKKKILEKVCKD